MATDGTGTSKASLYAVFRENADGLQADAKAMAAAATGSGQRPWQTGPLREWGGDPLDIAGMAAKFDRGDVGQGYADCLSDPAAPGTTADAAAIKLQNDWVAVQERAFRTRHATSVRSELNAAGRRAASQ